MAEAYPTDNELLVLTQDSDTGVEYIPTGTAPYYLHFRKLLQRTLLSCKRTNEMRIFSEGGLNIGVKAGKFWVGGGLVTFAGTTGVVLADDKATIYLYINAAGVLVSNEYTAFPNMTTNAHVRLAIICTANGSITSISDMRGQHVISIPAGAGGTKMVIEAHTANDTLTTGESGSVHTNAGATGIVTIILPANATAGTYFTFAVQSGYELRIDPGSKTIRDDSGLIADKYKYCSAIGASITLTADANGDWVSTAKHGTWQQEA